MTQNNCPSTTSTQLRAVVVMPALNEEASIAKLILHAKRATGLPVWVVDDCSADATVQCASAAGAKVIALPEPLGAWGATQTGLRAACREQFDCVVTMDSDGQHNPADIKRLLEPVANGAADVVIGSCPQRASRLRRMAWRLLRLTSGLRCADLTSGYRALNKSAIRLMASASGNHLEYQDVGVLLMLESAGLNIIEVPVRMPGRMNGRSKIFSSWVAVTYYMMQTLIVGASKRRRPKAGRAK